MAVNQLRCFGIGDGWPSADRNHSSFLYQLGGANLLIDCGEPISRNYKASGLSYDLVDDIFLSHLHFDHSGGFFMLMQGFWLERKRDLAVRLPGYAIPRIQQMLEAAYIFPDLLPFKIDYQALEHGQSISCGGGAARVTPFLTSHVEEFRRQFERQYPMPFEAFSFLVEAGGKRIGHSADIGAVEDLAPLLSSGPLDLLVCELAHVEPKKLFEYLRGRAIGKILFVHVHRALWRDLGETRELARQILGETPFEFPSDGALVGL